MPISRNFTLLPWQTVISKDNLQALISKLTSKQSVKVGFSSKQRGKIKSAMKQALCLMENGELWGTSDNYIVPGKQFDFLIKVSKWSPSQQWRY